MTEPKRSESLISGAIEAVGEQQGDDYVLAPAAHAGEFGARRC